MQVNFVLPHAGVAGGVRVVFEISNHLSDNGHEVNIIYPIVPQRMDKKLYNPKVRARQLYRTVSRLIEDKEVDWFDLEANIIKVPTISPRILNKYSSWLPDADATVATSWPTAYSVAALNKSKGEKFYFVQHYEIWPLWNSEECWEEVSENSEIPSSVAMADLKPKNGYLRRYKKLVDASYSLPLQLIITSEWERVIMNRLGQEVEGAVKYGVNFDLFSPSVESDQMEVLALYRNSLHKGDREAISAFESLKDSHPEANYLMFGPKKTEEIPDFVEFHKDPKQEKIRDLYSRADIFLYPSWVEGYGMPPMEAMACKTAIVSTDVGAVKEYSPEDGVRFVPIQSPEKLAEEARELIDSPEETDQIKERNYEYIRNFTWRKAGNRFEELITSNGS